MTLCNLKLNQPKSEQDGKSQPKSEQDRKSVLYNLASNVKEHIAGPAIFVAGRKIVVTANKVTSESTKNFFESFGCSENNGRKKQHRSAKKLPKVQSQNRSVWG